jgi:hypothetical protein
VERDNLARDRVHGPHSITFSGAASQVHIGSRPR